MPIDLRIAAIAERQHGVIRLDQLRQVGLSDSAVRSRVATGRLFRVHRGVYAVARSLTRLGEWLAAVFTAPGSALSHLSAAAHQELRRDAATIDLSVPRRNGRRRDRIRTHRVAPFHPEDVMTLEGIPCTSLPRTLIDIAPMVGRRGVERAISEAEYRRIYDRAALERAIERQAGRPGVAIVRETLSLDGIERTLTNRELEERLLTLVRSVGLRCRWSTNRFGQAARPSSATSSGSAHDSSSRRTGAGPTSAPDSSRRTAVATRS